MSNAIARPEDVVMHMLRSWQASPQQPIATQEDCQAILRTCQTLSTPADREWIAGRVATLLSHFYVSSMGGTEMRAVAEDWISALAQFPRWAIQEACQEYLVTQERKPTIAAIRTLTQAKMGTVSLMRVRAMQGPGDDRPWLRTQDRKGPSPADRAERARIAAEVIGSFASRRRVAGSEGEA